MIPKKLRFSTVSALLLSLLLAIAAQAAEESPAVDLKNAKAELEKSKQKEEKEPRKRLFFRKDQSEGEKEKPKKVAKKEKVESEDKPKEPRRRLFGRDDKKTDQKSEKEDKPKELKNFSLFGKKDDKAAKEKTTKPKEKAAPAKVEKIAKSKSDKAGSEEKRGFLGGIFKGDDSDKSKKIAKVEPKPKPVAKTEKKSDSGAPFLRMFAKGDSKEFSKAKKTKLGKTIESNPSKPSTGSVTKKSAASDELGWYVVTESAAPFYAVGPGQPMPPEKNLDRGSMLTVTKGGWGWCNVKLGSGELGVVSTKAIRPATIAEVNRHTRPTATASASKPSGSRSLFNILSRGPAPKLDLPTRSTEAPIRNFGLLPSLSPSE